MAVEGEEVAFALVADAVFEKGEQLRPERVEVVAAHIGAVAAGTDVVLAVEGHEARFRAEAVAQALEEPRLEFGEVGFTVLLGFFEDGLSDEDVGGWVVVDGEYVVKIGAAFAADVREFSDFVCTGGLFNLGCVPVAFAVDEYFNAQLGHEGDLAEIVRPFAYVIAVFFVVCNYDM